MVTTTYPGGFPPRRRPLFDVWTDADRDAGTSEAGAWCAFLAAIMIVFGALVLIATGNLAHGVGGGHRGQQQYIEQRDQYQGQ